MQLQELLEETLNTASLECWDDDSTPAPVWALGVQLRAAGLSLPETTAVLELVGVERSSSRVSVGYRLAEHRPDPPRAPWRVAVDETAVQVGTE